MKTRSKLIGIKMSKRTRKMMGPQGVTVLEQRRSGLAKVLGLLNKGTNSHVSNTPRAVEYTASAFNM